MEFDGLLLRKVSLDSDVILQVLSSCIRAMKRCFKAQCYELVSDDAIQAFIIKQVELGISSTHAFENPLKKGQVIVFAELWDVPCWFVLSEDQGGTRKIITVRIHKDKTFGDELAEVETPEE